MSKSPGPPVPSLTHGDSPGSVSTGKGSSLFDRGMGQNLCRLGHLADLVLPRRPLAHLFQREFLRLLLVHPARLHRLTHQVLVDLLERQQLPLQIRTMNAIRVIAILSTVICIRRHWAATTLTLSRERQRLDPEATKGLLRR